MSFIELTDLPKYKKIPAFVVGNGISRHNLDIHLLRKRGIVFGCNYFLRNHDFSDSPFFLICNDPEPLRYVQRTGFYRDGNLMTACIVKKGMYKHFIDRGIILPSPEVRRYLGGSAGHFALYAAWYLECDPIIFVGVGDPPEVMDSGIATDSIYAHDSTQKDNRGYREYRRITQLDQSGRRVERWLKEYNGFLRGREGFYKTNPKSGLKVPHVEWNDIISTFPAIYGVKPTKLSGASWELGVTRDGEDAHSFEWPAWGRYSLPGRNATRQDARSA